MSAPTLSGLAERGHLLGPRINLSTHISDVVEAAQSLMAGELVLVGHSYGGVVISGAAEQLGARVAGLAYVDAFLPEDGQSCAMFMTGPPPPPDGVVLPPPAEQFGIHRPEDRDWVDRMMTPHPANALLEPVTLRGARERVAKKCYILAVGRSRPAFEAAYEGVTNDPTWRTFRMNTGHHPMLDEPLELADLLETAFG